MGTSIIAAVATVALLALITLGFTTSLDSQVNLTRQSQAALQLAGDRARTAMTVTATSLQANRNLTLTLLNSGSVPVERFSQMDVLVTYTGGAGQVVSRLTYVNNNPAPGQWTVQSVTPQPISGVWAPTAALVISAQLPQDKSGGTGTVVVSTPNGVTSSAFF